MAKLIGKERDKGLDFIRFIFILMMVLYHCYNNASEVSTNYSININRYLGLVSGGFPWLSGYFIGRRYLHSESDLRFIAKKLFVKGVRLLLLYIILNMVVAFLLAYFKLNLAGNDNDHITTDCLQLVKQSVIDILSGKPSKVAYDILLPLGFLPIFCSIQVLLSVFFSSTKLIALSLINIILIAFSVYTGFLYMACGFFGVLCGFLISENLLKKVGSVGYTLLAFFYCMIIAYLYKDPREAGLYYILGDLMLFLSYYWSYILLKGIKNPLFFCTSLLSRHSLFVYIIHIPFLVILKIILVGIPYNNVWLLFFLYTFLVLSFVIIILVVLEFLFEKYFFIKKSYNFVFG